MQFNEGTVVICGTGQAGTVCDIATDKIAVLLANGNLWYGPSHQCHIPTSQEELEAAPLEVDRFQGR